MTLFLENAQHLGLQLVRQTLVGTLLVAFLMCMVDITLATSAGVVFLVFGRRPGRRRRNDFSVHSWGCSVGIGDVGGTYKHKKSQTCRGREARDKGICISRRASSVTALMGL
jgi:hypothetical protein